MDIVIWLICINTRYFLLYLPLKDKHRKHTTPCWSACWSWPQIQSENWYGNESFWQSYFNKTFWLKKWNLVLYLVFVCWLVLKFKTLLGYTLVVAKQRWIFWSSKNWSFSVKGWRWNVLNIVLGPLFYTVTAYFCSLAAADFPAVGRRKNGVAISPNRPLQRILALSEIRLPTQQRKRR